MREISPAYGMTPDEFLDCAPAEVRPIAERIRREKRDGTRPLPSVSLVDRSTLLSEPVRRCLIDKVAALVDENVLGRSDLCVQFALLLDKALQHLGLPSRGVGGTSIYYNSMSKEIFRWPHAWVRVGQEVIDANVDVLDENPMVPESVRVLPYWGPVRETPRDRMLRENHGRILPPDTDVENSWWPDLLAFLDNDLTSR